AAVGTAGSLLIFSIAARCYAGILIRSLQKLLVQSEKKENYVKILELLREQLTENADEIESV
ncbi:MAG: hypothetical protein RR288_06180, partial [Oscillibacter sp.]